LFFCSDQVKLIDLEELAKSDGRGKWSADASNVSRSKNWKVVFPTFLVVILRWQLNTQGLHMIIKSF